MTPTLLKQARRCTFLIGLLCSSSWAVGCGSGAGDGVTDDGTSTPTPGSAGRSGGRAGAKGRAGGPSSEAAGAGGVAGSSGSSGSGGNHAGASGGGGKAGSGGGGAGTGGSSGTSGGGGSGGAPTFCGNGIIEVGEECDDTVASPLCSNTCTLVSDKACVDCETAGTCIDSENNCGGPSIAPFTTNQQTQCYAVMACIRNSSCFDDKGTLKGTLGGSCYCGSLSIPECQNAPYTGAGGPNGPCAAVIQAGLPDIASNSGVLGNLTAASKPAGAAMQRLNCQKTADDKACANACGFTTSPTPP